MHLCMNMVIPFGLEHPFADGDGDSAGGTNPWTSNFYPEDTVMAYRNPLSGEWPQWFSPSDIRALVETWGLEDDQRGSYQLSIATSGQPLMIGDPVTAKQQIASGNVVLEGFKPCQSEIYGSSDHDELYGLSPAGGGWTDEWFYVGEGNDLILGGGGRDQLLGGPGDDTLRGGHGQDVIEGDMGNDQLYGGGGRNTLLPGEGQDLLLSYLIVLAMGNLQDEITMVDWPTFFWGLNLTTGLQSLDAALRN